MCRQQSWIGLCNWYTHSRVNVLIYTHTCTCTQAFYGPFSGSTRVSLIHRHYPKIYLKTCHKIILWQTLRCHKMMILRHILSQFTKLVLRDLKYFQDMTHCHSNYNVHLQLCKWYWHWHPYPFYPFVPVPARTCTSIRPSTQHFHNTAINVTLSWRRDVQMQTATFFCLLVHFDD